MAELTRKIEAHLGRSVNFETEVLLRDDGSGAYIHTWNITPEAQPTDAELTAAEAAADAVEALNEVQGTRKRAYPSIGDQLDMLWHAIDADTTLKSDYADFHTAIKAVKDANPKP